MLSVQVTGGILSFNVEPPPDGEKINLDVGDSVRFRSDLNDVEQKLVGKINQEIGSGSFEILKLGTRKHLLKNARGQESWVPWPFLVRCKNDPAAAPG